MAEVERLRQELRWLVETKVWLTRQGIDRERPDVMWELERKISEIKIMLAELEKGVSG